MPPRSPAPSRRAGADVAVTSTNGDPEEAFALRPLRRAIEAEGRQAIADIADLGNGSSVQIAVRQIAKQLGRLDLVVIAAGEGLDKPSERVTDSEWARAIGYNLGAYFYAARAASKELTDNEPVEGIRGRIIALLPALDPDSSSPVLLAARAGAEALLAALAREWAPSGIAVSTDQARARHDRRRRCRSAVPGDREHLNAPGRRCAALRNAVRTSHPSRASG